jgi:glucokinase
MITPKDKTFVLAGGIGGTKTNLGLFLEGEKGPVLKVIETFSSQNTPDLEHIIQQFLEIHPMPATHACFGIAGPAVNGKSETTNLPWRIYEDWIKKQFKFHHVKLVNDLTATAMAEAKRAYTSL